MNLNINHIGGQAKRYHPSSTIFSWLIFHGLDLSAVLVLTGIALSLWRRMLDRGARAVQSFAMDFLPLILLFAISLTGLTLLLHPVARLGGVYLTAASLLGLGFVIGAAMLARRALRAMTLFRYSNVYLALLFGSVALDVLVRR